MTYFLVFIGGCIFAAVLGSVLNAGRPSIQDLQLLRDDIHKLHGDVMRMQVRQPVGGSHLTYDEPRNRTMYDPPMRQTVPDDVGAGI